MLSLALAIRLLQLVLPTTVGSTGINIVISVLRELNRHTLTKRTNKTFAQSLALHCIPAASSTVQQHINEVIVQQVHLSVKVPVLLTTRISQSPCFASVASQVNEH